MENLDSVSWRGHWGTSSRWACRIPPHWGMKQHSFRFLYCAKCKMDFVLNLQLLTSISWASFRIILQILFCLTRLTSIIPEKLMKFLTQLVIEKVHLSFGCYRAILDLKVSRFAFPLFTMLTFFSIVFILAPLCYISLGHFVVFFTYTSYLSNTCVLDDGDGKWEGGIRKNNYIIQCNDPF